MSKFTPYFASAAERLRRQLTVTSTGCMEWGGATNPKGYGRINVNGRNTMTHRLAWELVNGPIPVGMKVLHHCDNPPCCNVVKCLFLGTDADNNADMVAKGRSGGDHNRKKTHCRAGHEYSEANTMLRSNGWRVCRICRAATRSRSAHKAMAS